VNGFTLWVGIGAALGLWRVARSAPQRQADVWVNAGLLILFASLIGARLFYTWVNRAYFANHLAEIPQIWLGGLAWPGAVGAVWLALLYLAVTYRTPRGGRVPLGWLGDRLYPLLPPLCITIWLGCWLIGSGYGPALPAGAWWGAPSLDESGAYALHWPLQPLAALSLVIFFWLLEKKVKPLHPPGRLSGLATLGLLLHLLATSLLRADPTPTWDGLRVDTWMALAYLACFVTLVLMNSLVPHICHRHSYSNQIES
jgi:prolipoprotein diacylglyceryltransferase